MYTNRTVLLFIKLYFITIELLCLHHTLTPAVWRAVDWNLAVQVCIDMGDICCIFHTIWFTFQVTMCICISNLYCENSLLNFWTGVVGRGILLVSVCRQDFNFHVFVPRIFVTHRKKWHPIEKNGVHLRKNKELVI